MRVRQVEERDTRALARIAREAFPDEDIVSLVDALLADPALIPELNLVAEQAGALLGHVIFTRARAGEVDAVLLAPLGVLPSAQRMGIGSTLVEAGLLHAGEMGFGIALVLGHPDYYPRFGFVPAVPHGILAPHPIEPEDAWMVVELVPGALERAAGVVAVAESFAPEEMWRE